MEQKYDVSIATMQADLKHLSNSFDEFKEDNRIYHENQAKRFDEFKTEFAKKIDKLAEEWQKIGGLTTSVFDLNRRTNSMEDKMVTKEQFEPVKKIVYGTVGTILLLFITGVCYLVFR